MRARTAGGSRSIGALRARATGPGEARGSPGQGPDDQWRAESWFTVRFAGRAGGRRVATEVSGGDPGYSETAVMLAECALCLAFDDLPPTSGQVTAAALGTALIDRLTAAGLRFTAVDPPPTTAPGR